MTAQVIQWKKKLNKCSFCEKQENQTKHFWSNSRGKHVCGECVERFKALIMEDNTDGSPTTT